MINMEKRVKMPCEDVMKHANSYFMENGLDCEESDPEQFCAYYSGGGGYVSILCCPEDKYTRINVEGREWEYQIKEFLAKF